MRAAGAVEEVLFCRSWMVEVLRSLMYICEGAQARPPSAVRTAALRRVSVLSAIDPRDSRLSERNRGADSWDKWIELVKQYRSV